MNLNFVLQAYGSPRAVCSLVSVAILFQLVKCLLKKKIIKKAISNFCIISLFLLCWAGEEGETAESSLRCG